LRIVDGCRWIGTEQTPDRDVTYADAACIVRAGKFSAAIAFRGHIVQADRRRSDIADIHSGWYDNGRYVWTCRKRLIALLQEQAIETVSGLGLNLNEVISSRLGTDQGVCAARELIPICIQKKDHRNEASSRGCRG
jgi:hypothetical protein